jgi:hypothetical protein
MNASSEQQLPLRFGEIDVDGLVDSKHPEITYWGKAVLAADGTWQCLANIGGCLCRVEINIRSPK